MTRNQLMHAAQIVTENYEQVEQPMSLVETVKYDWENCPESFECLGIQTKEDIDQLIDWLEN